MQSILDDKSQPFEGEEKLAALTAGNRAHWANNRLEHFFRGANRQGLDAIEKAAFMVILDDVAHEYDEASISKIEKFTFPLFFLVSFRIIR